MLAHAQAGFVDGNTVDHRIRAGQIDILEDARRIHRLLRTLTRVQLAVETDEHGLPRLDVANDREAKCIERHRLGGNQIFGTLGRLAGAIDQRADAIRVAESEQTVTSDDGHHGIGTTAAAMHTGHCLKDAVDVKLIAVR